LGAIIYFLIGALEYDKFAAIPSVTDDIVIVIALSAGATRMSLSE
jgi:hypothetical protein